MKKVNFGTNFVVFLLFFGVALFEALQSRNWGKAALWSAIGLVFLLTDNFGSSGRMKKPDKQDT